MRIFFDTNVLIAAFVAHGVCSDLFEYCLAEHTICISQQVLDELHENFIEKFGFSKNRVDEAVTFVRENAITLTYDPLPSSVCRDPNDDDILAASVSGKVDCLITGDEDLLILKNIQGIPILKPSDFWKFEKEKGG